MIGNFISSDIINQNNGKIYYEAGFEIDEEFISFKEEEKDEKE